MDDWFNGLSLPSIQSQTPVEFATKDWFCETELSESGAVAAGSSPLIYDSVDRTKVHFLSVKFNPDMRLCVNVQMHLESV